MQKALWGGSFGGVRMVGILWRRPCDGDPVDESPS
jgi:hypothetical protein